MAVTTKIIVQQILNIDDTKATASKFPRYTVTLGNSISSITASELVSSIEAAAKSAAAAKDSEIAAKTSELNAKDSEQEAAISAGASEASATQSATSATQSAASADRSAESAAAAKVSETNAKASETKAKTSETNAKVSETNAKTSETKAKASETNAKTSETNAAASTAAAKISETNAKISETNAAESAADSRGFRNEAEIFSGQAAASASAAKISETNAKNSETNAKASETNAAGSATSASQSVTTIQGLKSDVDQLKSDTQAIKNSAVTETTALKADVEQLKSDTQAIKNSAVTETTALKADVIQLKTDTQSIKDSAVSETTTLKNQAAASATQAGNSAVEAGQQASNAASSAQSAATDAGRAEVAAGKAEGIIGKALLKENNLSDLTDRGFARGQLAIDLHVQDGTYTFLYSQNRLYRFVVGSDGICQFQKAEGQSWVTLPLSVLAGGTGSTNSEGARNSLQLGVDDSPQFKNIHLYDANTLASGTLWCTLPNGRTRLYHEVQDGVHKTTLETYNQETDSAKYLQYDEHGHLTGVLRLTAGNIAAETVTTGTINCNDTLYGNIIDTTGTILSRAGVYTTAGKPVGVQTPEGAGGNHSIAITTSTSQGDAPVDSWVNYLQGNYYNGNYTFGAVRGGATQIQSVRLFIDSGEGYNSTFEFKPLPANNGYIRSERGFYGRCRPVGWLDTHYADVSPFFAPTLEGNDTQWMPIVTGASRSTRGYMLRTSLGVISQGNAAWPDAVIQLLGDNVVQRTYNFSAMNGDLSTWVGGAVTEKGWTGNYMFQKAATSDRDLKCDIVYTDGKESYDRVMQWLPTMFKYTGSNIQRFGLIAQDLLKIDPEYVKLVPGAPILEPVVQLNEQGEEVTQYIETGRNDDTLALDNNVIMTDLACAFRYQADKVNKLEQELTELKKLVSELIKTTNS